MPNPSFFLPLILQSALLPFVTALAVLAAARARHPGAPVSASALAAGFVASYFAILYAQWSPAPKTALDWLPWIAVLGSAAAIAIEHVKHGGARLAARLGMSIVAAGMVLWPAIDSFGVQKAALSAVMTGGVICVAWSHLARAADARPTPPLLLTVVAAGTGLALMLDSSQSLGQLSGALAAGLAGCVAFGLPRRRIEFSAAGAGAATLLLGSLMAAAHFYAGFSLLYVALLAGGLLADVLVAGVNRLRRQHGGAVSWAVATVLAAIPVAATIGLAVKAAQDAGGY